MPLKNGRTTADLQTILVGSVIPSGTIAPFGGGTVPAGWMLCDGTAISRTTYSALFTAINTTYGVGDGASTFNLPNAQGVFLRGAGSQTISSITYSATRGTKQGDSMQGHFHQWNTGALYNHSDNPDGTLNSPTFSSPRDTALQPSTEAQNYINAPKSDGSNGTPRTGSETRPANLGVNYIIKL